MSNASPATLATIARIRELIKTNGVRATARLVDRTPMSVSLIKNGHRHRNTGALTVNALELRRGTGKLCRCCGNQAWIVAPSGKCANCEILELAKQGVILLASEAVAG